MKTKKLIVYGVLLMLFIVGVSAYSTDISDFPLDTDGDTIGNFIEGSLQKSWWQKVVDASNPLTMVGGALCTDYANEAAEWVNSPKIGATATGQVTTSYTTQLCKTNYNHIGQAYQVFEVMSTGWKQLGEKYMLKGEQKCFPVEPMKKYYWKIFYCDNMQQQCTNWGNICHTATQTKMSRICKNTGIEIVYSPEDKRYVDLTVPLCTGSEISTTSQGTISVKMPSSPVNPVQPDVVVTASSGNTGDTAKNPEQGLAGSWANIIYPVNVEANKDFEVRASFKADAAGVYYLESGISKKEKTLATYKAQGSKCDGNLQYAGKYVQLAQSETADMIFIIQAPDTNSLGINNLVIGAYTGCFSTGGKEITAVNKDVNVIVLDKGIEQTIKSEQSQQRQSDQSKINVVLLIFAILIAGYVGFNLGGLTGAALGGLIVAVIWWFLSTMI